MLAIFKDIQDYVAIVDRIQKARRQNQLFFSSEHHRILCNFTWESFVIAIDSYYNYEISNVIEAFQKDIDLLKKTIETEKKRPERIAELLSLRSEHQVLEEQLRALKAKRNGLNLPINLKKEGE